METQIERSSEFLNDVTVVVVFNDDPRYLQIKPMFEQYGFGFVVPEQSLMIIDGEILVGEPNGVDVLKFIEAHEISHILLGHTSGSEIEEIEADLGAYILLKDKGYNKSIEILINSFQERHGVEFDENMLDNIKDRMLNENNTN